VVKYLAVWGSIPATYRVKQQALKIGEQKILKERQMFVMGNLTQKNKVIARGVGFLV
jgi:hypothetical protein